MKIIIITIFMILSGCCDKDTDNDRMILLYNEIKNMPKTGDAQVNVNVGDGIVIKQQ